MSVICLHECDFLQTSKARAEARLEALRGAGVSVDEWLNESMGQGDGDAGDSLSATASAHSDFSDHVSICACAL